MISHNLEIKTADGLCDAFVAYPKEGGNYPGVIFLMDGFGLREYLCEMAQKIASAGYFVLLPNLYYRTKKGPVFDSSIPLKIEDMPELLKQVMPLIQSLAPDQVLKDMGSFIDFLSTQRQVSPGLLGLTGYCMGGRLALLTAAKYADKIGAMASFHSGNLATEAASSPHLLLDQIRAELYFAHADNDKGMDKQQIARLTKALEQSGVRFQSELYTGAAHGFTMRDLPVFNQAALDKHWQKLFDLFHRNLSAPRVKV